MYQTLLIGRININIPTDIGKKGEPLKNYSKKSKHNKERRGRGQRRRRRWWRRRRRKKRGIILHQKNDTKNVEEKLKTIKRYRGFLPMFCFYIYMHMQQIISLYVCEHKTLGILIFIFSSFSPTGPHRYKFVYTKTQGYIYIYCHIRQGLSWGKGHWTLNDA